MKKNRVKYDESEFDQPFVVQSEFEVRYPSYREGYIKSNLPAIEDAMLSKKLSMNIDHSTRTLSVRTSKETCDPYIVVKAHQFLRLLCRGISLEKASGVLEDGVFGDVVRINNLVRNRKILANRKERLVGKNEAVLRALRILTRCYVEIQGDTVACVGPYQGVNEVKHVVEKAMKNVHPVFLLKQLMVKRKLECDESMKTESWDRYIPPIPKARKKDKKGRKGVGEDSKRCGAPDANGIESGAEPCA